MTSNSPPRAFTIRRKVEICMSDGFSSFDRQGLLDAQDVGNLTLALARELADLAEE